MTNFIGITEAQSNPFAPLTSELVKQLRDNPLAIARGATGAPRVWLTAMERLEAGETVKIREDDEVSTSSGLTIITLPVALQFGTLRFSGEHRRGTNTNRSNIRINRTRGGDTTTLAEGQNNTTSYVLYEVDFDVMPGDIIDAVLIPTSDGTLGRTVFGRNFRIQTNNNDIFPVGSVNNFIEGNRSAT